MRHNAIRRQFTTEDDAGLEKGAFSFWRIVRDQWGWRLFHYEAIFACFIALGAGIPLAHLTNVSDRIAIAGDFLTLISAILGLLLAAFALVVAFFTESYTMLLQRYNPRGVRAFFSVFMINIGVDVGVVLLTIGYRAGANYLPSPVEKPAFVALAALFVYALLNVVAVTRNVMAHGVTRAELIELEQMEKASQGDGTD
jgi:hypothetical protein